MASSPQHEPTMEEILASIRKIIAEDSTETPPASPPAAPAPVAPAPVVEAAAPVPEPDDADVLDLTQELVEEPVPTAEPELEPELLAEPVAETLDPAPEPEAPAVPEHDIVFETIEDAPPEPEAEPVLEAIAEPEYEAPVEDVPVVAAAAPANELFSDKTRKALDDAFANIEDSIPAEETAAAPPPPPPLPSVDARTIEAVFDRAVRETVDPVMTKWLSDNHDAVVARMTPMIREWLDEHFPAILEGAVRDEVARVVKARGLKK